MSERKKHIAVLNELLIWMDMGVEFLSKDDPFYKTNKERREAIKYAISSLETDEAYQLEYEKPEICEDCVPRKVVERIIKSPRSQEQMLTMLNSIPSVLPKATKNDLPHCQHTDEEIAKSFIEDVEAVKDQLPCGEQMDFPNTFDEFANEYGFKDKDEVYTNGSQLIQVFRVKQWLEHISTTKNDLGVDAISREKAIKWAKFYTNIYDAEVANKEIMKMLKDLPSVPIRPKGHWIDHSDDGYVECPKCGSATNCDDNIADLHFCFSCGAELRGSTKRKGNPIEGNNESYNCENWIP